MATRRAGGASSAATLLKSLDDTLYVTVLWDPPRDYPVNVYYVRVNDTALTPLNPQDPDSPRKYRVPPALVGTAATITWFAAPTVSVTSMGVALASAGSGAPKLLKKTSDPAVCGRGGVWQDRFDGKLSL